MSEILIKNNWVLVDCYFYKFWIEKNELYKFNINKELLSSENNIRRPSNTWRNWIFRNK